MSASIPRRFFVADTGLLWNIAIINRLDLLDDLVSRTGTPPVWAEQVRFEIGDHIPERVSDYEAIFGPALCPETAAEEGLVHEIQMLYFRGNDEDGGVHLGESQSVAICASRFNAERVFMLTEDRSVRDFCTATRTPGSRHQKLVQPQQWHGVVTQAILTIAMKQGKISETQRDGYYQQLQEAGRPLIPPA